MNASEVGSKDWWMVVRTMPLEESFIHLSDYRISLLQYNAGHPQYINASTQIAKVNVELKRLNRVIDDSRWYKACKNVLDQELFDAVLQEKRRLEDESRTRP